MRDKRVMNAERVTCFGKEESSKYECYYSRVQCA